LFIIFLIPSMNFHPALGALIFFGIATNLLLPSAQSLLEDCIPRCILAIFFFPSLRDALYGILFLILWINVGANVVFFLGCVALGITGDEEEPEEKEDHHV